jgi:hypothetical protein
MDRIIKDFWVNCIVQKISGRDIQMYSKILQSLARQVWEINIKENASENV